MQRNLLSNYLLSYQSLVESLQEQKCRLNGKRSGKLATTALVEHDIRDLPALFGIESGVARNTINSVKPNITLLERTAPAENSWTTQ